MENTQNYVILSGELVEPLMYAFTNTRNVTHYRSSIIVRRKSENHDEIPLIIPKRVLGKQKLFGGTYVRIEGTFASRTLSTQNEAEYKILYMYVKKLEVLDEKSDEDINEVKLTGKIDEIYPIRQTTKGYKILGFCINIPKFFNKTNCLPCVAWDKVAMQLAEEAKAEDIIQVEGRLQSRDYIKVNMTTHRKKSRKTYEVAIRKYNILTQDKASQSETSSNEPS